jgi:hypothetical protein
VRRRTWQIPTGGKCRRGLWERRGSRSPVALLSTSRPRYLFVSPMSGGRLHRRQGITHIQLLGLGPSQRALWWSEMLVDGFSPSKRAAVLKRRVPTTDDSTAACKLFIGNPGVLSQLRGDAGRGAGLICMRAISHTHTLGGDPARKRAERPQARYINTEARTLSGAGAHLPGGEVARANGCFGTRARTPLVCARWLGVRDHAVLQAQPQRRSAALTWLARCACRANERTRATRAGTIRVLGK